MARADKTVVLNVRVTERQAAWLRRVAEDQHAGNLSEAVRQAVTDSWVLRRVREEYRQMRDDLAFQFPPDENGMTRGIELLLSLSLKGMTWDEGDVEWL